MRGATSHVIAKKAEMMKAIRGKSVNMNMFGLTNSVTFVHGLQGHSRFAADMYEKSYLKEEVDLSNQRQVWMKCVLELSWRKLETDELDRFAADMYEKSYLKEEVDLSNQRQVWMKYVLELSWRKLETDELDRVLKELQNI
ncbi:hypothetical protein Bca101_030076 [Brassica carinata]